jgi:putative membrane protein
MRNAADVLVAIVAVEHVWFLVLEMFLWQKPFGLKTFRHTPDRAQVTAVLAANQGLYNGFLAAGLVWSLFAMSPTESFHLQTFFLTCVAVAGIYGGLTASRSILYLQALPGLLGLVVLWGFRVPA